MSKHARRRDWAHVPAGTVYVDVSRWHDRTGHYISATAQRVDSGTHPVAVGSTIIDDVDQRRVRMGNRIGSGAYVDRLGVVRRATGKPIAGTARRAPIYTINGWRRSLT